jgi:rSAM/selenodomain-associated transferase 1
VSPPRAGVLVVFAKVPRPGRVKTRMVPPLTEAEASGLYASLLADVLDCSARFARARGLEPVVAVHPAEGCREIARAAPPGFRAVPQRGANLSQRLAWAAGEAAAAGARRILLRGSDSPALDRRSLARALVALDHHDLVLCPDLDGGYSLVGLRRPAPGLFDHPMSTHSVMQDTLARAAALGLRARVEAPRFDVDTVDDLKRLAALRARPGFTRSCRHTLEYADRNDLWRHLGAPEGLPPPLRA